MQQKKDTGLLDIQLYRRQAELILVEAVSAWEKSLSHKQSGVESYGGHFLYTMPAFELRPKEDFVTLLSFTQGFGSLMGLK